MRNLSAALIYIAFFGLIGFSIWFSGSLLPLWALILTPVGLVEECDCEEES